MLVKKTPDHLKYRLLFEIVDSMAPWRCTCNLKWVIFKRISMLDILSISNQIALIWMPEDLTDD